MDLKYPSTSAHVHLCLSFYMAAWSPTVAMDCNLLNQSSSERQLGCCHITKLQGTPINTGLSIPWPALPQKKIPSTEITRTKGMHRYFTVWSLSPNAFPKVYANLYFYCINIGYFPPPRSIKKKNTLFLICVSKKLWMEISIISWVRVAQFFIILCFLETSVWELSVS